MKNILTVVLFSAIIVATPSNKALQDFAKNLEKNGYSKTEARDLAKLANHPIMDDFSLASLVYMSPDSSSIQDYIKTKTNTASFMASGLEKSDRKAYAGYLRISSEALDSALNSELDDYARQNGVKEVFTPEEIRKEKIKSPQKNTPPSSYDSYVPNEKDWASLRFMVSQGAYFGSSNMTGIVRIMRQHGLNPNITKSGSGIVNVGLNVQRVLKYKPAFQTYSNEFGLRYQFPMGVCATETGGALNRTSKAGAGSIMQIMPGTAEEIATKLRINVKDIYNYPETSIRAGTYYLAYIKSDSLENIAKGYNGGPSRTNMSDSNPKLPRETRDYHKWVRGYQTIFRLLEEDKNLR